MRQEIKEAIDRGYQEKLSQVGLPPEAREEELPARENADETGLQSDLYYYLKNRGLLPPEIKEAFVRGYQEKVARTVTEKDIPGDRHLLADVLAPDNLFGDAGRSRAITEATGGETSFGQNHPLLTRLGRGVAGAGMGAGVGALGGLLAGHLNDKDLKDSALVGSMLGILPGVLGGQAYDAKKQRGRFDEAGEDAVGQDIDRGAAEGHIEDVAERNRILEGVMGMLGIRSSAYERQRAETLKRLLNQGHDLPATRERGNMTSASRWLLGPPVPNFIDAAGSVNNVNRARQTLGQDRDRSIE